MTYTKMRLLTTGVFLAFIISACSDLNVSPRTAITPSDMGQNDVEQLLNGVYLAHQNQTGLYNPILFDMLGGNLTYNFPGRPEQRWIENDLNASDGINTNIWVGYFRAIDQTNNLIEVLGNLEDTPRNEEVLGIAHFLRAYAYYGLVTRYGDVPILRGTTFDAVPRDPESEVWDFVKEDLDIAIELAPRYALNADPYYATAEAAIALQARTALATGDLELAVNSAEEVIESGHFNLENDFENIFRGTSNSETIFGFENRSTEGIAFASLFTTVGYPTGGSYFLLPAEEVREDNLFSNEDERKSTSITMEGDQVMVNKYLTGVQGGDPVIVTRIAEMYLISAEAQGLDGIDRLNELRVARGLDPLSIDNLQEYEQAVAEERRKELLFEGFRWYDLIRTGRAIDELPHVTSENQLRLPIPERELDTNPELDQNDGY